MISNNGYSISKSSFLKLEQCSKAFYLYKNHPYLRDKPATDKMLTFKRGHDVGIFAQQLFPGGTDVSQQTKGSAEAVELTAKLIKENVKVIYEAAFVHQQVLIIADILVFSEGRYQAYEIKSSMKVSEVYLKDAYLQYYVLKNALPDFDDLFLVTLNPDYRKDGAMDPKKMFRKRSVKEKANLNAAYFEHQVRAAMELLERAVIPDVPIGKHCFKPYQCDFFGTCWKQESGSESIFNLPLVNREKILEWYGSGIRTIAQLNEVELEKEQHLKVRQAFISKDPFANRIAISDFLKKLKGHVAVMDMEIWSPAIPEIEGTRCFEQLPFLVSLYDGKEYDWHFEAYDRDGRLEFAEALAEQTAKFDTIVVYDRNLEIAVINNLMQLYPRLVPGLDLLKAKIIDIFEIFLNLHYYRWEFGNNFSLKTVSSILLPEVAYSKIGSGLEAMNYFERYRRSLDLVEKEELQYELIQYCNTDCEATFRLIDFLKSTQ